MPRWLESQVQSRMRREEQADVQARTDVTRSETKAGSSAKTDQVIDTKSGGRNIAQSEADQRTTSTRAANQETESAVEARTTTETKTEDAGFTIQFTVPIRGLGGDDANPPI